MSKKILRFTASWCQPCKMLAANLENADVGVPIEVVDVDVLQEVAQQYGIRGIPTLVLVDEGTEVARTSGVKSVDEIREWISAN